ncbi:hypothetical protein ACW0JT_02330 [Arthrobacter sp. SA17]
MPGESGGRLTVSVGRREFEDLTGAWAAYLEVTQTPKPVDPVLAMQRAGSVLRSLDTLAATVVAGDELPGADDGGAGHRG